MENIQNIAIATRGAKAEDFEEFLQAFEKKEIQATDDYHKNNMAMLDDKL